MKIVMINGVPGVGKTEIARHLVNLCPEKSAWIDTDRLIGITPFEITAVNLELIFQCCQNCVENARQANISYIVLSGVFGTDFLFPKLWNIFESGHFDVTHYVLTASDLTIKTRIYQDEKLQDATQRVQWTGIAKQLQEIKGAKVIETEAESPLDVAMTIAVDQRWIRASGIKRKDTLEELLPGEIREAGISALVCKGLSKANARRVVDELLINEQAGYFSHGLQRIPEYCESIEKGFLIPSARPECKRVSPSFSRINGNKGLGILVADEITDELTRLSETQSICAVGLTDSGHLGRLGSLLVRCANKERIALGFLNYNGHGQIVPPFGAKKGVFNTNPIGFSAPLSGMDDFVFDMTTSVVSEGEIRNYAKSHRMLPGGYLVDSDWRPVFDPAAMYQTKQPANLIPLGGVRKGYKGSGLALLSELLSGVINLGGHAAMKGSVPANCGFFIAINLGLLGVDQKSIISQIDAIQKYCYVDNPPAKGFNEVRYPGQNVQDITQADRNDSMKKISISASLWSEIKTLIKNS